MKRLSGKARFLVMAGALAVGSCFLFYAASGSPEVLHLTFLYTTRNSDSSQAWLDVENRQHDPMAIPLVIFLEKRTPAWMLQKVAVLETVPHIEAFPPGTTMVAASISTTPGRYRFVLVTNPTNSKPSLYVNARRRFAEFLARRHVIDYKTWHRMQGSTVILSKAFDVPAESAPKVQ